MTMSDRKPTSTLTTKSVAWIVTIPIMIAIAWYVGMYYAVISAYLAVFPERPVRLSGRRVEPSEIPSPEIFAPIHWLDRRIRPHVWEPKP